MRVDRWKTLFRGVLPDLNHGPKLNNLGKHVCGLWMKREATHSQ